jgi:hypothetical protein
MTKPNLTSDYQRPKWSQSVKKVGRGGRGFVMETNRSEKLIITAAHCLPRLPPRMTFSHPCERTYPRLIGELGKRKRPVTVECLFVDPVADLAVLGAPDNDEGYDAFFENVSALPLDKVKLSRRTVTLPIPPSPGESITVRAPPRGESNAWLLSPSGKWFRCHVIAHSRSLQITDAAESIEAGMSGSPIVDERGNAIGVVTTIVCGAQPCLARQLPGWLLEAFAVSARR